MRLLFCLLLSATSALAAAPEYGSMGPDIFDRRVAGEELVSRAIAEAQRDDKRILLLFGANWCPWCRRLHKDLTEDRRVRAVLSKRFVLVFVDANTRNDPKRNAALLERYGNPTLQFGLPVFVVLDRDGKQLATRETASLAADTDAVEVERILAFLNEWASPKTGRPVGGRASGSS